nr:FAD-binding oxidoreductase [Herbaspirillum rubrisubalbicans]
MTRISAWGRLSHDEHRVVPLFSSLDVAGQLRVSPLPGLAHGAGRSYGDVALNPGRTLWVTTALDRFISFNPLNGRLICEAGMLLRDIQRVMLPQGWMLPVTPGTQIVTVGGAIANDVHGKNHHRQGSFGDHVVRIRLIRTDGQVIECGPMQEAAWFAATVGGLGLTGLIAQVELQLRRVSGPWLASETIAFDTLQDFFRLSTQSEDDWEYSVAWIDCLSSVGRGLFMRATHGDAELQSERLYRSNVRKKGMPFVPPVSLVNRFSLRPFNSAYYHLSRCKAGRHVVHYEPFSYPLDNLLDWNRMYGPKGFYQYQSVVPMEAGPDAIASMLQTISGSGEGSFLAVLKTFGARQSMGMLGFPRPGVTLALDFPNQLGRTQRLFDRLDSIVREAGGAIYPAKDARMPRDLFESGYPRLQEFLPFRDAGIRSALSRRLMGY